MDRSPSQSEIICAVATAEGISALAVVRLSGSGSAELVEGLMGLPPGGLRGMRRKVGTIVHRGRELDQVVALGWPEGSSYTGEEMVEVICHGVPETVRRIVDSMVSCGARRAEPGEFTRRAYAAGKLSALQVIALASRWRDGGDHGTAAGRAMSSCEDLLTDIERAQEVLEGEIEFLEEHSVGDQPMSLSEVRKLAEAARKFRRGADKLETENRILLMGPVNAGKSTLFNLLAGREKALVSEIPGTTRDGSSCRVMLRGRKVELFDTAGAGGGELDGRAYRCAVDSMDGSETVVWMTEGEGKPPPEELLKKADRVLRVFGKSDIFAGDGIEGAIRVSSITGEGVEELKEELASVPGSMSISGAAGRIYNSIQRAMEMISSGELGIAAELLGEAGQELRGLMGRGENVSLSVDRALSSLCAGK